MVNIVWHNLTIMSAKEKINVKKLPSESNQFFPKKFL